MRMTFHGAAQQVSGSCTLLESASTRVLVDCGLFQGSRHAYEESLAPFPFDPSTIDAVIMTHAHIDHTGRIPKLVREGFKGRIFATHPTRQLAHVMWQDAAQVMKRDAARFEKPVLYGKPDVRAAYELVHGVQYGVKVRVSGDITFTLREAGHIFGSAFGEFDVAGTRIVMSGDVGNDYVPILRQTADIVDGDVVVMESTYGDRVHDEPGTRITKLEACVKAAVARKGILLIPAFSLERTQEILYELNELVEQRGLPRVPIFLDSPLATKVLPIYKEFPEYYDAEARELRDAGDDFFRFPGLEIIHDKEESTHIIDVAPPKVIIAGSGMMHGGRIMGHLAEYLDDPNTTVMVVGYQGPGTVGRAILDGANAVHIDGKEVTVRAQIENVGAYSAHGDRNKLLRWVASGPKLPSRIILNHGELHAQENLAQHITEKYGIVPLIPGMGDSYEL
jgi:metallo-beta-lactamase family protein